MTFILVRGKRILQPKLPSCLAKNIRTGRVKQIHKACGVYIARFSTLERKEEGVEEDTEEEITVRGNPITPLPTLEDIQSQPLTLINANNDTIVRLALEKNRIGCIELLKRHIMIVDSVEYAEACKVYDDIKAENGKLKFLAIPNKIGVVCAGFAAFVSFPLCFEHNLVHWFNEHFVTADIPEPKDLETWLEVGSWAWNWMEPVMGQLSFFLLCLAFARSQFQTLGIIPYSEAIKDKRALTLSQKFPMYDPEIISMFSKIEPFEWSVVSKLRRIRGLQH